MAGDYIDATLGAAFTLSTMAAAGLGNMVSDVAGIFCADVIEDKARIFKYGRYPNLSAVQKRLWPVIGAPQRSAAPRPRSGATPLSPRPACELCATPQGTPHAPAEHMPHAVSTCSALAGLIAERRR